MTVTLSAATDRPSGWPTVPARECFVSPALSLIAGAFLDLFEDAQHISGLPTLCPLHLLVLQANKTYQDAFHHLARLIVQTLLHLLQLLQVRPMKLMKMVGQKKTLISMGCLGHLTTLKLTQTCSFMARTINIIAVIIPSSLVSFPRLCQMVVIIPFSSTMR
jgi:hypothetical protein